MIFGSRFAAPDLSDLNPFYWMPSLVLCVFPLLVQLAHLAVQIKVAGQHLCTKLLVVEGGLILDGCEIISAAVIGNDLLILAEYLLLQG